MDPARDPLSIIDIDLRPGLERVEERLIEVVRSDQMLVQEAAGHLIRAGGKRFRAMLVLLSGHLGDANEARLIDCAASIELTHLATLYHDDVIDETSIRRGVPTVNAKYGNSIAVLTGDFLFARASGLATDLGTYTSRRLADTVAELCEGVIIETAYQGQENTPERYLEVISRKTASLIATSCHLGAHLAGAPPTEVEAVTAYGRAAGMAYQLADDILDIVADEAEFGKTPGTDVRAGFLTLPVLETLAGSVPGAAELRVALQARDVDGALGLLRSNGSVELARQAVAGWQQRALDALSGVRAGPGRDALARLVEFVGDRTS